MNALLLLLFAGLCGRLSCLVQLAADEDMHVRLTDQQPDQPSGSLPLQLDLYLPQQEEDSYLLISTESGQPLCNGAFSRDNNQFLCNYDKQLLKHGDNIIHIMVLSKDGKRVVSATATHFFYGNSEPVVVPLLWPRRALVGGGLLLLGAGAGGAAYNRGLLSRPTPISAVPKTQSNPQGQLQKLAPPRAVLPRIVLPHISVVPLVKAVQSIALHLRSGAVLMGSQVARHSLLGLQACVLAFAVFGWRTGRLIRAVKTSPIKRGPRTIVLPPKPTKVPLVTPLPVIQTNGKHERNSPAVLRFWRTILVVVTQTALIAMKKVGLSRLSNFQQHAGVYEFYVPKGF